jgi:hypothetical protein
MCNLTQIDADSRRCPQFHGDSGKPVKIPADYSRTEELPSPTRKPFCGLDLHRRIRCSFRFRDAETRRCGDSPET